MVFSWVFDGFLMVFVFKISFALARFRFTSLFVLSFEVNAWSRES